MIVSCEQIGVAIFDYNGRAVDELTFCKGQKIECESIA